MHIESLESRTHFSVAIDTTVTLTASGTLLIRGGPHSERYSIRYVGGTTDEIQVFQKIPPDTIPNNGPHFVSVGGAKLFKIKRILIDTGKGNDKVTVDSSFTKPGLTMNGGAGNDTLAGFHGNDTIIGGDGNDQLFGNAANDVLIGGRGRDQLFGGLGDDSIRGGGGQDKLFGDDGADTLRGNEGSDYLAITPGGPDLLDGGAGHDQAPDITGPTFIGIEERYSTTILE